MRSLFLHICPLVNVFLKESVGNKEMERFGPWTVTLTPKTQEEPDREAKTAAAYVAKNQDVLISPGSMAGATKSPAR